MQQQDPCVGPGPKPASARAAYLDGCSIKRRYREPAGDPHKYPLLHDFGQIMAARFDGRSGSDDTAQPANGRGEGAILMRVVLGSVKGTSIVVADHLLTMLSRFVVTRQSRYWIQSSSLYQAPARGSSHGSPR